MKVILCVVLCFFFIEWYICWFGCVAKRILSNIVLLISKMQKIYIFLRFSSQSIAKEYLNTKCIQPREIQTMKLLSCWREKYQVVSCFFNVKWIVSSSRLAMSPSPIWSSINGCIFLQIFSYLSSLCVLKPCKT